MTKNVLDLKKLMNAYDHEFVLVSDHDPANETN